MTEKKQKSITRTRKSHWVELGVFGNVLHFEAAEIERMAQLYPKESPGELIRVSREGEVTGDYWAALEAFEEKRQHQYFRKEGD